MDKVIAWNPPVKVVREWIEGAGTKIGSVHFKKREDGSLRKMSYRLHVQNPSVAKRPNTSSKRVCEVCGSSDKECKVGPFKVVPVVSKKVIDDRNDQMTVLDTNKTVRDENGKVKGRGAWRTIPLENVVRICNNGVTYIIEHS